MSVLRQLIEIEINMGKQSQKSNQEKIKINFYFLLSKKTLKQMYLIKQKLMEQHLVKNKVYKTYLIIKK